MAQTRKVRGVATQIHAENGWMIVTYHSTDVVKWTDNTVVLNTGGWKTATTKTRMNQAANQFDLGYSVYQRNFDWYVTTKAATFLFGGRSITIDRDSGGIL